MPAELDAVSGLLIWGPLGIFNVIQMLAIRALVKRAETREDAFRAENAKREEQHDAMLDKVIKSHRDEMAAIADRQRAEMVALSERHLAATNTWTQHYQVWAERATAVLEALYRRSEPRR